MLTHSRPEENELRQRQVVNRIDYVPFGRPNFSDREIAAMTRVLRSGWVGMGPETIAFEEELAAAIGAPRVVTLDSCTGALFLSILDKLLESLAAL